MLSSFASVAFLWLPSFRRSPDLVALNVTDRNVHQHAAQQLLALLAGQNQELQNRVAVNPREPFRAAYRVPFDEELKSEASLVLGDVMVPRMRAWASV